MEQYLSILRKKNTGNILSLIMVLSFVIMALIRLYPFENSLLKIVAGVDDWKLYASFSLDIKRNGILMPSFHENYYAPAGFLYNYFVALCFYIFGENIIPVYIIQSLLLGFSVVFIYQTFKDKLKPITGIVFLFVLFLFALVDVSKYYSFRLLSENLAIFTVSGFFFCFIKGIEKNKLGLLLLAAIFMGLSISIRPNIFPFGIILIGIAIFYFLKQQKAKLFNLFLFSFLLAITSSLLALRNHFVCGGWTFFPTLGTSFGENYFNDNSFSFSFFIKKIAFCLGILTPLEPDYQWRPHWILMWTGYFIYLVLRMKDKKKFELWEVTTHLFIFCYYVVLFLFSPQLGSYGIRFFLPVLFIILPFSFMAIDKLNNKK